MVCYHGLLGAHVTDILLFQAGIAAREAIYTHGVEEYSLGHFAVVPRTGKLDETAQNVAEMSLEDLNTGRMFRMRDQP